MLVILRIDTVFVQLIYRCNGVMFYNVCNSIRFLVTKLRQPDSKARLKMGQMGRVKRVVGEGQWRCIQNGTLRFVRIICLVGFCSNRNEE